MGIGAFVLLFPLIASAATYMVTNTNAAGNGSLDWAITQANANPGNDNIHFNIPGGGPHTIQPPGIGLQALWDQSGVTIDGYTEPGAQANTNPQGTPSNAVLMIEIDGTPLLGTGGSALYVASSNNIIQGLVINRCDYGIVIDGTSGGGATNNQILGCYVGTNVAGTLDLGCTWTGIYIFAAAQNNFVGDGTPGGRCVCSGSDFGQIDIVGANTDFNTILGNYIGTELNGMAPIGNVGATGAGVAIYLDLEGGAPTNNLVGGTPVGDRNIISGNPWVGIEIAGQGTDFNRVENNYIGTDVAGTGRVGNGTAGVYILDFAAWNTVGGPTTAHLNIISNNNWGAWGCGVDIDDGAHDNLIEGNYIGTDVTGMADHGNLANGVHILDGSPDNTVQGNLIYWNRIDQVRIEGMGSDRNIVINNSIGRVRSLIDVNQTCDGVHILDEAQYNVIGQAGSGNLIEMCSGYGVEIENGNTDYNTVEENTIRDCVYWGAVGGHGVYIHDSAQYNTIGPNNTMTNNDDGVRVSDTNTDFNTITQNSIYSNAVLGIDLEGDGVTANDNNDPDGEANQELNFPVITSAVYNGTQTNITGTIDIDSSPSSATVELFQAQADPSGYGEGQTYLGAAIPDAMGNWTATVTGIVSGNDVTATTTDTYGNTSEFCQNAVVTVGITITTSPGGLGITVDGIGYTASQTFYWVAGSQHTIGVWSPQPGGTGIQYVFNNWSDGLNQTHTIVVPSNPATYTAYFTTQYLLTTAVNPSGGGSVAASPTGPWYNSGTVVTVTANPSGNNYSFSHWTGSLSGSNNPDQLTMNSPMSVTAHFSVSGPTFTDETSTRLPSLMATSFEVDCGDVDGDNDLDLAIANSTQQNRLFLNDGSGNFTDVTSTQMPTDTDGSSDVEFCDTDGDGDLDMVIANHNARNKLYQNDGLGNFADVTASRLPASCQADQDVDLGDVDGDGAADMVTARYSGQNGLYLNDGNGTFNDVTASRMPVDTDLTQNIDLGDVDGDGDLDILVANGTGAAPIQNRLYLNDGTGTFTDATSTNLPSLSDETIDIDVGDVDGDGDLDIAVANGAQDYLLINNGSGVFTDVTATQMPVLGADSREVDLGDVDNDGDVDMFLTTRVYPGGSSGPPGELLVNLGNGVFVDVTSSSIPSVSDRYCFDADFGDFNGDTDLDIIIVTGDPSQGLTILINQAVPGKSAIVSNSIHSALSPSIISLTPDYGSGGTPVVINGGGWSPVPDQNGVSFGGSPVSCFTANISQICFVLPGSGSGSQDVTVTAYGQTSTAEQFTVTTYEGEKGDVNGDGSTNVIDVLAVVNHILGIQILSGDELLRADCNGDGVINILDALGIVNKILGIGDCVPLTCKTVITPEGLEILKSLEFYLSADDFDRLMTLVKQDRLVPEEFDLSQNYPNPFNPRTDIGYQIPDSKSSFHTTLKVYNLLGQEVRTLVDEVKSPGYYTVTWEGKDNSGNEVPCGVYFYRMRAGDFTQTRKMTLIK